MDRMALNMAMEDIFLLPADSTHMEVLNAVYEEAVAYFCFDPGHAITTPKDCMEAGDLPPSGIRENFHILCCYVGGSLSGYLTFYEGYPEEDAAYICFFYLRKAVKRRGVGTAVVQLLSEQFRNREFAKIRVSVSLKNWSALRFWVKQGFDTITLVACDTEYSRAAYGCVELEKSILSTDDIG